MPAVAVVLVDMLRRAGVARLFAGPAGAVPELLEAARSRELPIIECGQEPAAIAMAAVTGELTGRPGVALGAGGPASAAALARARIDRAPMILLTSTAAPDAALLGAAVKGTEAIGPDSVAHWAAHGVQLALGEPRGPVHLDLPAGVAGREALALALSVTPGPVARPDEAALDRAADLLRRADRPLVVAGLGCRAPDAKWLRAFAEAMPAPVLTTGKGKGAVPDPHPLALGVLTGGPRDDALAARADLVVTVGLDAGELPAGAWPFGAPVVSLARHAAADPDVAGAGFTSAVEVVGEPGAILEELAPRLARRAAADWDIAWLDGVRRARRAAVEVPVPGLAPHRVVQIARELSPEGAIAAMGLGPAAVVALTCWDVVESGECLVSSGPDPAGFALPAAMAAQLVHPDRRVLCVTDGAALVPAMGELETLARLGLPVVVLVLDDSLPAPLDWMRRARAAGLRAWLARDEAELHNALRTAAATGGPALIDARVDPSGYPRIREIAGRPHRAGPGV